ncbi:LacI family transcriptional regulator [Paenibacillus sp. YN15]|nr:LacI family transcriptional regulator [Paenibacillus sp. YN15]
MKNKQITIVDVARAAGVSIATVSNVLNRRNVPLAEETIRKVEEAVQSLGYRRNEMAASLSRKKTYELGLVLPHFGGYFADFAHVMQNLVHQCGYHLSVYSSSGQPELEKRHMEMLLQRRVDGLFCHGLAMNPESTRKFVGEGTPMVLFNAWNWPENVALGAVNLDFAGGAEKAVRHLVDRGCKHLFYISREGARTTNEQRLIGFQRGVKALGSGQGYVHRIIPTRSMSEDEIFDSIEDVVKQGEMLGILAFDDGNAFQLISLLQARGYHIPGQIKVVGINNQSVAMHNWPSITSLDIDLDNQVSHAVFMLLQHLEEGAALRNISLDRFETVKPAGSPAHEIHIPMRLIPRMSTE